MENNVKVNFYDTVEDTRIKFAVIVSRSDGKWVFCKHKERDTFEVPGGHREPGEAVIDTAGRELREETGAVKYSITPVCYYSVTTPDAFDGEETFGGLFFAEIESFEDELHSEIESIRLMDDLPDRWTYPLIQPLLIEEVCKRKHLDFDPGERALVEDLIEKYFSQKDVVKRHDLLKKITFKCEFASKEFFDKAYKKERKPEEKLTALRGLAYYASEQEVEPYADKLREAVMKISQSTPYAYNLYEDMRAGYLLPYLVKTYNYRCFIELGDQVEKQYEAMPDVFKNIYSFDENGEFFQIRDPGEVNRSISEFFERKRAAN